MYMKTIIKTCFTLTGRFEPTVVTFKLGHPPTKTWHYGEQISNTLLKFKHDGWQLSMTNAGSIDVENCILDVLALIYPSKTTILELSKAFELSAEISASIELDNNERPILHFKSETIRKISELNAELDIDIY